MSTLGLQVQSVKPSVLVGSDPAANTEATLTLPVGGRYQLLAVTITCAQGATQTPLPSLQITNSAGTILASWVGASAAQNASVTAQYTWAPNQTLTAAGALTFNTAPIALGLILPGGFILQTSTSGKGANTNHGALTAWVLRL